MDILSRREPLLAAMLSFFVTGFGQVYAGRVVRGAFLFFFHFFVIATAIFFMFSPFAVGINTLIVIALDPIFAIFVGIDAYFCALRYNKKKGFLAEGGSSLIVRRVLVFLVLIFFLLIFERVRLVEILIKHIRVNLVQCLTIRSVKFEPVLFKGDKVVIDRLAYKKTEPRRGEILGLSWPGQDKVSFVKVVFGLPGDTITIRNNSLLVNGNAADFARQPLDLSRWVVQRPPENASTFKVPQGYYYVLGDSVALVNVSLTDLVPRSMIAGRVIKVYYPLKRARVLR